MKKIYLDYAASTPVAPEVLKAMKPYFGPPAGGKYGNPSSLHSFGMEAMAAVDKARETIAKAIGADFREIIFTGSATEANNLALRGVLSYWSNPLRLVGDEASKSNKSYRIIVSAIEHESVLKTARDLEMEGCEVVCLPVDREGFVDLKKLESALNKRTILVSVMYANNEIGTTQPISEIAKIIKNYKLQTTHCPLFHTDAVQAFQFLDCDVNKLGVDLMTLSAHKIYGPKGIGALYVRLQALGSRDLKPKAYGLEPIITGGGQEFGFRSGTENVPSIVGFAKAIELVSNSRELEKKRAGKLRDYFWRELKKNHPLVEKNGGEPMLPNILNVYFPGQDSQYLLIKFDLAGIAVSSGAACSARSARPLYVLQALGFSPERARSSIRFSLGRFTTKTEITEALKRIKNILK